MRFTLFLMAVCLGIVISVPYLWGGEVKTSGRAASAGGAEPGDVGVNLIRPYIASPRVVLERFDSLLTDGSPEAVQRARLLTTGAARRLFPILAETQLKVNELIDTARSRDTILETKYSDARGESTSADTTTRWAALKVRADIVFKKPFLGMRELSSVQVIHMYRLSSRDGWKIAEFEELAGEAAAFEPRSGALAPHAVDDAQAAAYGENVELLPLSRVAPSRTDHARVTRLRLNVSRRDGAPLTIPMGPSQKPVSPGARSGVRIDLETSALTLRDSVATGRAAHWPDSLALYLASTGDLDLTDKLLRTRAAKLAKGSPSDVETARRVWRFVSTSFDYTLGATLFATSREALRDMKGDCSEAAVLTAALLRAAGIPSRVVLGYASLGQGVWIGHAWAEAWLGGSSPRTRVGWVGVDAALREFPAGPHRLALVTLSGAEDMKAAATNLMLSTLSNLDIEITGAWAGDTPVPLVTHPAAAEQSRRFWQEVMEGMGQ